MQFMQTEWNIFHKFSKTYFDLLANVWAVAPETRQGLPYGGVHVSKFDLVLHT